MQKHVSAARRDAQRYQTPDAASSNAPAWVARHVESNTSSLTFLDPRFEATSNRMPMPAWGPISPPRPASSVGSCSPASFHSSGARSPGAMSPQGARSDHEDDHYQLLGPFAWQLALVSANGGQDWCPTAGLFLARYTHFSPTIARDPAFTGLLTATALLLAAKLIEAPYRGISRLAPVCRLVMERSGDFALHAPSDLVQAEGEFLQAIQFSIAARPEAVARYGNKIAAQQRAQIMLGGSLHDEELGQAIARLFTALR